MNMRSSGVDEFLLFCNQLKKKSSLVSLGGTGGKLINVTVRGRITAASVLGLIVEGRGCELHLDLEKAAFRHWRPKDGSVVTLRREDPAWAFRPMWEIRFPRGGVFILGEVAPRDK
jgi:hypothetical protein